MKILLALAAGASLAQAIPVSAQSQPLPGNPPYLWSQLIGDWATADGPGGPVEIFASSVSEDRAVAAFGVIWYRDSGDGQKSIAQVRYPADICGAVVFKALSAGGVNQVSADQIDLSITLTPLDEDSLATGSGPAALRVLNGDRAVHAVVCP